MNRPILPVDAAALRKLEGFDYPGNIRELENMIERAIVIGNGKRITLKDLPQEKTTVKQAYESLDDREKSHISQILKKYDWNISRTARALKVDRVTLYNKIKKFNLKPTDK
jgi:transcriptional regulator of acetoin/glycerol metabolism